jgi:hypothetical protein
MADDEAEVTARHLVDKVSTQLMLRYLFELVGSMAWIRTPSGPPPKISCWRLRAAGSHAGENGKRRSRLRPGDHRKSADQQGAELKQPDGRRKVNYGFRRAWFRIIAKRAPALLSCSDTSLVAVVT